MSSQPGRRPATNPVEVRRAVVVELPMFPLGTVLLPHMAVPLHVFEPRYRALVRDVLADEGRFGVTLIRRGSEVGGGDQRFAVGTTARIAHAEELEDGRWLLVALGEQRLRVDRWLDDDPYPRACVELLADQHDGIRVADLHERLVPRIRRVLDLQQRIEGDGALPADIDLLDDPAVTCWQDPAVSPVTPLDRQRLLETEDCASRLELLDDLLVGTEEVLTFRLLAEP
jgi:uncharacterized protein